MGKNRLHRWISAFISAVICVAVFSLSSSAFGMLNAAPGENATCTMEFESDGDCDHVTAVVKVDHAKPGDVITVVFVLSNNDLYFTPSEGIQVVSYDQQYNLTLKITGKKENPNDVYTIGIGGFNIEKDMVGKKLHPVSLSVVNTKPGPGGENGGPGGKDGPAGPGGPGGPADKDKPGDKPVQTESLVVPESSTVAETKATETSVPESSAETTEPVTTTSKPTETTAVTESTTEETTLPETSEEMTTEAATSPASEMTVVAVPGEVDTDTGNTDPSEGGTGEMALAETTVAATVPAKAAKAPADYSSFIWLLILLLILLIVYLRYRVLAKKNMSFPEICKNFIPVGAVVKKIKDSRKKDDTVLDGPQPEVMNGYLQKPTVGLAAANAIRPVRSNVSQPAKSSVKTSSVTEGKAPVKRPGSAVDAKAGETGPDTASAPQRPGRRSSFVSSDPELLEMERRQKIMEQEMKQIFSNREKLPESGDISEPS